MPNNSIKQQLETRNISAKIGVRAVSQDGASREIFGRAIPFDAPSLPIDDEFVEYIASDAFDESLADDWEVLLLNAHNWGEPLARRSAGRLTLEKREDGIYFAAQPPDTTRTQDLLKDIDAGNVAGCSFGFIVRSDEWTKNEDGMNVRRILKGDLYEISTVVNPAYPDTSVAKRSLDAAQASARKAAESLNLRKAKLRLLQAKSKIKNK